MSDAEFVEFTSGKFPVDPTIFAKGRFEVRSDGAGNFDELFGNVSAAHLEMMDDATLWMSFTPKGTKDTVTVVVTAKRGKLVFKVACNE